MMAETKAVQLPFRDLLWRRKTTRYEFGIALIIGCLGEGLKRKLKTGLVLAFVVALIILFVHPDYRNGETSLRGTPAKDFQFTLDGKPAKLSDFRGKVVLLNFWASWCPPCVDEAPGLNLLQERIASRGGTILGVSEDADQNAFDDFLKTYNIRFSTYRDPTAQIKLSYGTTLIPDTYVIRRDGRIDRKLVGAQDWTSPEMTAYMDSVLNEK
jgi:cytochrome c biogenesis protein CcmG/thiol:disulfide interchange protein DsbE